MFRDFVKEHNPKDMLDVDEFLAMRKEVLAELSKDGEKKASVEKQDLSLSDITMTNGLQRFDLIAIDLI